MSFAEPLWLWALLALPVLLAAELWVRSLDRGRITSLVARSLWGRVLQRPREVWRWLRLALVLLGVAAMVLALARPQWGIVREKVEREGVDVVLVLDTSGSMSTEDVQPSRFFFAKSALLSLIERLGGDRFALVAFEGEAYPLVPLTLDADAIGLFLETLEPGAVPSPGTSLGVGLQRGIDLFVDKDRNNKVMVLISDGEDLEGEIDGAVTRAKKEGVVIHTVGVGTEKGAPVPDYDRDGNRAGFKKQEDGSVVVSRLDPRTLQAIAGATGGVYAPLRGSDTSLWQVAAAIDAMEQKTLAREFSYRRKERFQIPLAVAISCLALGLLLPLPSLRRTRRHSPAPSSSADRARRAATLAVLLLLLLPGSARAEEAKLLDELTLRPQRLNAEGRKEYTDGNHPEALESFEGAASARPDDPRIRFNLASALYKAGKYDEAAAILAALANSNDTELAAKARYNLGNTLFQRKDYGGAATAYKAALQLASDDLDTRRNLELALRAIQEQEKQRQQDEQQDDKQQQDQQQQDQQQQDQQQQQQNQQQQRPKTEEEKEQERFQQETGMPKERAMQLLEALQQNEKEEQRKLLAAQRAGKKKKGKDW